MARIKKDSEKIQVTFNKKQMELIREYKGLFGEDDAEIVRYIVTNWLLSRASIIAKKKKENVGVGEE